MNKTTLLFGGGLWLAGRSGLLGKNVLDLRESYDVKYIDVSQTNFGLFTQVRWWNDWKYNRQCDQITRFYIRPVEVIQ